MTKFALAVAVFICAFSIFVSGQRQSGEQRCGDIDKIKQLPHDRIGKGVDATFDKLVVAGEEVVPCLIANITNQTVMNDPRCPAISSATTIGDVSFFVLVRIMNLEMKTFLPEKFRDDYKTQGVYAYHHYIDTDGSRKELQQRMSEWYAAYKEKQP